MLGNAKALKRNNRECKRILIGPSMAPRFFEPVKFARRGFFTHCPSHEVGFGPKFYGTDGKPTRPASQDHHAGAPETQVAMHLADAYARAERRTCSSGPRPAQHPASLPSITTAGTLRTPKCFALEATSDWCMSWITTSCEEPAIHLASSIVSLHVEQPAVKISIFFLVAIFFSKRSFKSSSLDFFLAFGASLCMARVGGGTSDRNRRWHGG
jgi:hypothetical protein